VSLAARADSAFRQPIVMADSSICQLAQNRKVSAPRSTTKPARNIPKIILA
jgi:hypothetical protein